ncbi:MAG: ribonuclease R [Christensenellales bacterium]|jgi:ribonuclease R
MEQQIEKALLSWQGRPPGDSELADALDPPDRAEFYDLLEKMRIDGRLVRTRRGGWTLPRLIGMAAGKVQRHPRGYAFLIQDDPDEEDIFIPAARLNGAMHGDRVLVMLGRRERGDRRVEAEVREVLSHGRSRIVGLFEQGDAGGYVTPDDTRIGIDLFIPRHAQGGALGGMKVVAEITRWPEGQRGPAGRVIEVLGPATDVGVDILSIIREMELPDRFPERVLREAKRIPQTVPPEAVAGRLDLRGQVVFTIDGADAKDLDDAVSIEPLSGGGWRLGVHIADVSSYVRPGTALDEEAFARGTSVYLVDRVVPMLPEALSNGICSLNPGVDRLTLSCVMDTSPDGEVKDFTVSPSVIRSVARMTYDDVNRVLDEDPGACREYDALVPHFTEMARLAQALNARRMRRGSLELDIDEAYIEVDDEGKPVNITPRERGASHRMIEEFMLCANETVAAWLSNMEMPAVYRIHEQPDPDKMEELALFAEFLGCRLSARPSAVRPGDLQALLRSAQNTPEENILGRIVLRSMRKARYSPENKGHFGLAATDYCHFTSPIRRYPDLFVHRVVHAVLAGSVTASWLREYTARAAEVARQSSEREIAAQEAERAADDLKMTEYMSRHVGEVFDGIISGVTEFGLFVELPSTIEGLVRMSSLDDDYYVYDEKRYCLIGRRTRRTYRLGDPVQVECMGTDLAQRRIEFEMAD